MQFKVPDDRACEEMAAWLIPDQISLDCLAQGGPNVARGERPRDLHDAGPALTYAKGLLRHLPAEIDRITRLVPSDHS